MTVEIREAALEDLETLMEWRMRVLHEVFSLPSHQPAEALERENRRYYQDALPTGAHIACFARLGDAIVGCGGICFYNEMPSPDNPTGACAYLMNIYTCPRLRGQGIGKAIVLWLIRKAKQRHITKIYLESSKPGKALYQALGFTAMPDMMQLPSAPCSEKDE